MADLSPGWRETGAGVRRWTPTIPRETALEMDAEALRRGFKAPDGSADVGAYLLACEAAARTGTPEAVCLPLDALREQGWTITPPAQEVP